MNAYHKKYRLITFVLLIGSLLPIWGCKKFIELDPPATSVNEGNIYKEDATAAAALTGIYGKMASSQFTLNLTVLPELAADNLSLYSTNNLNFAAYFQNALTASDPQDITRFWIDYYPYIFTCNTAIAGISNSNTLNETVKKNLLGEAYFLRAFLYFHLVNFYGDVPLALGTDYTVNTKLPRTSATEVYSQVTADLIQAVSLLPEGYVRSDAKTVYPAGQEERVRPNKFAALTLLARVYLYNKDWPNAEKFASEVIANSSQYAIVPLEEAFLKNTKESIWSLQPVRAEMNTDEGDLFNLPEGGPTDDGQRVIYLADDFYASFQTGDQRRVKWTGLATDGNGEDYPYASKYKLTFGSSSLEEYAVVLRFAELYLIRAEARIEQNKVAEGIADLNTLRDRAIDKSETDESKRLKLLATSLSKEAALIAVIHERRVELFCELGHRWFDLKRTGRLDAIVGADAERKGAIWASSKSLLPVPAEEIRFNPALKQNTGY